MLNKKPSNGAEVFFRVLAGILVALILIIAIIASLPTAKADPTEGWGPPPASTFACEAIFVCDENGENCKWITICP